MSTLDGSIVNIAVNTIMNDLKAPLETVEWVMIVYLLVVTSLLAQFRTLERYQREAMGLQSGTSHFFHSDR